MATVYINPGEAIQTAINGAPVPSTFILRAGVHRMQQITPRSGDIITGEKLGSDLLTTLTGARNLDTWTQDGAQWYITGQTQAGVVKDLPAAVTAGFPRANYPEDLFMDKVLKKHVATLNEVGADEWFFDYAADRIYVGDNPNGRLVETSVTPTVFTATTAVSNVLIKDLIIEMFATPTLEGAVNLGYSSTGSANWTCQGCLIRFNHGGGVYTDPNCTVRNCTVVYNGGFGFQGAGLNILIEGNEIAYNNTCGYDPYWGAGGSKWVYTVNLTVRKNYSHHNNGPGFWTDVNNIYTVYEHNKVEDNLRGGIFHEISYDCVIRHNTIRRNGTSQALPSYPADSGIDILASRNVEVYENVLKDNAAQGITALDDHRGTGDYGPWTVTGLNVHNNIVQLTAAPVSGFGWCGMLDTAGDGTGIFSAASHNRWNNNQYTTALTTFMLASGGVNFAAWQAAGYDPKYSTSI